MIDDVLARLRAGLDEDERIALAAHGDTTTWVRSDGEVFAVTGALTGPHRCSEHEQGVPNLCDDMPIGPDTDFDPAGTVSAQMIQQQPRRTLRQVEAIRKVLGEHRRTSAGICEVCRDYDFRHDYDPVPWPCPTVQALASIYTDPTEEKS